MKALKNKYFFFVYDHRFSHAHDFQAQIESVNNYELSFLGQLHISGNTDIQCTSAVLTGEYE